MSTCAIKWCGKSSRTSNYQNDGITFHRFPIDPDRKEKWIKATSRGDMWFPKTNSVICSRHFTEDTFYPMKNRRRLMDTAVPTLYLPILAPTASPISSTVTSTCVTGQGIEAEDQTLSVKPLVEEHDVGIVSVRPDSKTLKPTETDIASTPRKKRSISPIAMSPSAYNSPVKKRLCKRVKELTNIINIKNKNLRKLRDSNRRLKRQIVTLKSLLEELEKKDLITSEDEKISCKC